MTDYAKLFADAEILNKDEFAALLHEHSDRYHNNDTTKNKDEKFIIIPDRVYDLLVFKYEKRFGPYTRVGCPVGGSGAAKAVVASSSSSTELKRGGKRKKLEESSDSSDEESVIETKKVKTGVEKRLKKEDVVQTKILVKKSSTNVSLSSSHKEEKKKGKISKKVSKKIKKIKATPTPDGQVHPTASSRYFC